MESRINNRYRNKPGQRSILAYIFLLAVTVITILLYYPLRSDIGPHRREYVKVSEIKSDTELIRLVLRQFKEQFSLCHRAVINPETKKDRLIVNWVLLDNDFTRRYTRDSLLRGDKYLIDKLSGVKSLNIVELRTYRRNISKSNLVSFIIFLNDDIRNPNWSEIPASDLIANCHEAWIDPSLQ